MVSVQGFWLCFLGQNAVLVLSCLCLSLCQERSQHCVAFSGAGPSLSQGPRFLLVHSCAFGDFQQFGSFDLVDH